ncbi:hypothetical protein JB92DRAFT_2966613 [Gautieria morchelliformis]|nr:hypothetical protein JB92DRAFT_2966613 [Gautieria morchelliformis]
MPAAAGLQREWGVMGILSPWWPVSGGAMPMGEGRSWMIWRMGRQSQSGRRCMQVQHEWQAAEKCCEVTAVCRMRRKAERQEQDGGP